LRFGLVRQFSLICAIVLLDGGVCSFHAGIDLHARTLYLCALGQAGAVVRSVNRKAEPGTLLAALAPWRAGLVVGCECNFAWHWLAGLRGLTPSGSPLTDHPRRQGQER